MVKLVCRWILFTHRIAGIASVLVVIGYPLMGYPQEGEQRFAHLSSEHGLSNSTVECVLQDSRGFMWFATADGLNRYDGYQMTVYRNIPEDTTSILNNYVLHLFEDSKQRLWITSSSGVNRYDRSHDNFHRYTYRAPSASNGRIPGKRFIYEDAEGTVWAGTRSGLQVFNEREGKFEPFVSPHREDLPAFAADVTCMVEDRYHNLWIGTAENGLYKRDRQGNLHHFLHIPDDPASLSHNSVTDIKVDLRGQLWIGTLRGLNKLVDGNRFIQFTHRGSNGQGILSDVVKCIAVDHLGKVWVGTENGGINVWDEREQRFLRHENHPWKPYSLSQKTVSSITEDNQGNIWIGTHRGGVNVYHPQSGKFKLYTQGPTLQDLSYKDVKAFHEGKDGMIYIGTDGGGLNSWDRRQQRFSYHKHHPADEHSIGSDAVLHIMEDSDGDIWVGTWQGGLNKFDPTDGTFRRYMHDAGDEGSIASNNVWQILEDRHRRLWIATEHGGLNLFDKSTGRFKRVAARRPDGAWSATSNIHAMAMDTEGHLWIGCSDGALFRYDETTDTFTRYPLHRVDSGHVSSSAIKVIYSDGLGNLWVGAEGLYRYNPVANRFNVAPCADASLQHEMVQSIEIDDRGTLWLGTGNGLVRYNPEEQTCKRFNTADGLQGLEFGPKASLKTISGELLFGGFNGFNIFHPDSIRTNVLKPPVYLTDFQLSNQSVRPAPKGSPLKQHITEAGEIVLDYSQSAFSFWFAAINYVSTTKNQYAYMLEGFDNEWQYVGNSRTATYTNLNPGNYVFKVKASNNDGVWNDTGRSINLIIKPPFWMTWWFRTSAVLLVLGICLFYLRLYRRLEIEKMNEQKMEEMHDMQLQFFTNISHEFRTPLSLIMGGLERANEDTLPTHSRKYIELSLKNTHRLSSLINELMNFRKASSGMLKLKVGKVEVETALKSIEEDFHTFAEQQNIGFAVTYHPAIPKGLLDMNMVEKILLNLLNNAFKYSKNQVSLHIFDRLEDFRPRYELLNVQESKYKGEQYCYFVVADDGIGMAPEAGKYLFERYYRFSSDQAGTGIGLAFVKVLALLHKGFVRVYSTLDRGTEILIGLPIGDADYTADEQGQAGLILPVAAAPPSVGTGRPDVTRIGQHTGTDEGPKHAGPSQARLILVVEDNVELRTFLCESLRTQYRVLEAADGLHALQLLDTHTPDLIISDVKMPNLDGIAFCKQVKENEELSHIPFMLLTAKDSQENRLEGVSHGADHYFAKPISLELLAMTIQNIFSQHQKLKLRYLKDYRLEMRQQVRSTKDQAFIDKVLMLLEKELENPELSVEYLCQQMGMSQTKFYKRLKAVSGKNITEFIRTVRLKKAAYLITHDDMAISEVMNRVGISSASYFTAAFKREFGKTPSQYQKETELV